jgi:phosphoribosyl 1,2-cyclic phosphodiesterase
MLEKPPKHARIFGLIDQRLTQGIDFPAISVVLPFIFQGIWGKIVFINTATCVKFWGVRGSIPTPGPKTVRIGGNTSCVEIRCGREIIILDAGTGLRTLGQSLLAEFKNQPLKLTLLLTHTHWDHIQGLPFFGPIYHSRCRLRILGCEGARKGLVSVLTGQMESTYFPVPFDKLPSNIEIEELKKFDFKIGPVRVRVQRANHPGMCVGYRLSTSHGSVAYFPDSEPRPGGEDQEMIKFLDGVNVLILDSQYDTVEYERHAGWGHGCVDDSVELALAAKAKRLCLFHHDPERTDKQVDAFLKHARQLVTQQRTKLKVDAAREGMTIRLGGRS